MNDYDYYIGNQKMICRERLDDYFNLNDLDADGRPWKIIITVSTSKPRFKDFVTVENDEGNSHWGDEEGAQLDGHFEAFYNSAERWLERHFSGKRRLYAWVEA
jgi:hypothetical protein